MLRHRSRLISALCALLLLTACAAGPLTYGPRTAGVAGYEDVQLGENTWQVRIAGVWPDDWPDMEKFALYRAAEVTETQGGVAFEVIGAAQQLQTFPVPVVTSSMLLGTTVGPDGRIIRYDTAMPFYGFARPTREMTSGTYYLDYRILGPAEAVNAPRVLRPAQVMRDLGVFISNRARR